MVESFFKKEEGGIGFFPLLKIKNILRESWENIFDINCTFDEEIHNELSTQATMWEIRAEWVLKAEQFVSR